MQRYLRCVALLKVRKGKIGTAAGREQNVQGGEQNFKLDLVHLTNQVLCPIR